MPLSWNEIKDRAIRDNLLECTGLDWGKISPAIFGSLFQSVMNPEKRRNLGAALHLREEHHESDQTPLSQRTVEGV